MEPLIARMRANLAAFPRHGLDRPDLRHAGVAVLVAPHEGEPGYVITRRAKTLRRSAGNYALPGGRCEPGETAVEAALRETAEELGVTFPPEAVLGRLDDFVTLTGFVVTPVVIGSAEPITLKPDPQEVGEAWFNPISELDHPDAPMRIENPDGGEPILRMPVRGRWMNPPTAAFLLQFREVAVHGRWTRVAHVGQPSWTAR